MPTPTVPARNNARPADSLAALPSHRRLTIALAIVNLDGDADRVFGTPCVFGSPTVAIAEGALRGDDGRLHLARPGGLGCGLFQRRGHARRKHSDWLHWWSDGDRYRLRAPVGQEFAEVSLDFVWRVRPADDELIDPALVPPGQRCPLDREHWPGYTGGTGAVADIRRVLVDALGPACSLCRERYPFAIDHDHETGAVRGYLCRDCNSRVERCVHVDGCPRAEYLNDPPAEHLGLVHPKRVERRRRRDRTLAFEAAIRLVHDAGR